MKHITSKVIGQLNSNKDFDNWWDSEPIKIPLFDDIELNICFIDVSSDDHQFMNDADEALSNFLKKNTSDLLKLSKPVYDNCMDFLNDVGYDEYDKAMWEIKDEKEIWNFVDFGDIYVSRRHRRDMRIYISVTCSCDWEQEHGLQLVFWQGKELTRISTIDSHLTEADAYNTPDNEDELLSKFVTDKTNPYHEELVENETSNTKRPWWKKMFSK